MIVTRKSQITGLTHTRDLPITQEQIDRYERGALVQDAFPHLPAPEREFIMTGTTPEEYRQFVLGPEADD